MVDPTSQGRFYQPERLGCISVAVALVKHQAGSFALEFRGDGTSLSAHQTPLCGDHFCLKRCPGLVDHYTDRRIVGEDSYDISATFDFRVQPFQRVSAVQLLAVSLREGHVSEYFILAAVHQRRDFRIFLAQLIGHQTPLLVAFNATCHRQCKTDPLTPTQF